MLGVHKITLRFDDLLEGFTELRKVMRYTQWGDRFKLAKAGVSGWSPGGSSCLLPVGSSGEDIIPPGHSLWWLARSTPASEACPSLGVQGFLLRVSHTPPMERAQQLSSLQPFQRSHLHMCPMLLQQTSLMAHTPWYGPRPQVHKDSLIRQEIPRAYCPSPRGLSEARLAFKYAGFRHSKPA
jgi:hypothetical protein